MSDKPNNNAWGWVGTITGITGGVLVALNFSHSRFGYIFFMFAATAWIIQGSINQDRALILLNAAFIVVNLIGIYRWFF